MCAFDLSFPLLMVLTIGQENELTCVCVWPALAFDVPLWKPRREEKYVKSATGKCSCSYRACSKFGGCA